MIHFPDYLESSDDDDDDNDDHNLRQWEANLERIAANRARQRARQWKIDQWKQDQEMSRDKLHTPPRHGFSWNQEQWQPKEEEEEEGLIADVREGICAHELAWKIFVEETASPASITFQEIPWPPRKTRRGTSVTAKEMLQGVAEILATDEGETTFDQQPPPQFLKAAFRLLSLRWHPDKFRHTWAARIQPDDFDEITAQVLKISQEINNAYQQFSQSKVISSPSKEQGFD